MKRLLGIDEVGRGPWAGPLVVGACVLREPIEGLTDSKKLTARKREALAPIIHEKAFCGLGWVSATELDEIGLSAALRKACREAVKQVQAAHAEFNGIIIDGARYSAWYAEDGIHIANGTASQYVSSAKIISWTDAAERIGKMLDEGIYATNAEIQEAPRHEREALAQALWYLYHDLSEEARDQGYLSLLENKEFAGFPNETEALTERLLDPAFQRELTDQFSAFWTAQTLDRSLLRFNYHRLDQIYSSLRDLSLERRTFSKEMSENPRFMEFITDDEVFSALARSGNVEGSKSRIYAYFMEPHTGKERADFLKAEYGIGGRSHALSGASHSSEDYDSKGIRLRKRNCIDVQKRLTFRH